MLAYSPVYPLAQVSRVNRPLPDFRTDLLNPRVHPANKFIADEHTLHWINFKGDARLINNGPSNGFSFGSSESMEKGRGENGRNVGAISFPIRSNEFINILRDE